MPIYLDGLLPFVQIMLGAVTFGGEIVTVESCSMGKIIMEAKLLATAKGGGLECGHTLSYRFNRPGPSTNALLPGPMA